jgi:hypothetical protein
MGAAGPRSSLRERPSVTKRSRSKSELPRARLITWWIWTAPYWPQAPSGGEPLVVDLPGREGTMLTQKLTVRTMIPSVVREVSGAY